MTFLEALPRVAPFEEPEISDVFAKVLRDEGADVHSEVRITRVGRDGERRVVVMERDGAEQRVDAERILVATGRRPNTQGLGLDVAGVKLTERGAVRVDEFMGTTNPRIWAAGDVTGAPQFVYVAAAQGSVAAENAIDKAGRSIDWTALPRVTFTSPQIASVGMTSDEALKAGHRVESRTLELSAVPRALVNRDTRGLVKLVADEESGRVLGVHVLADSAGEVILAGVCLCSQEGHDGRRARTDLGALPHDGRGDQARRANVHARRVEAVMLRSMRDSPPCGVLTVAIAVTAHEVAEIIAVLNGLRARAR